MPNGYMWESIPRSDNASSELSMRAQRSWQMLNENVNHLLRATLNCSNAADEVEDILISTTCSFESCNTPQALYVTVLWTATSLINPGSPGLTMVQYTAAIQASKQDEKELSWLPHLLTSC